MTRSVLEGVSFGIKDSFTLIQRSGLGSIDQVRISGGGAKSPLWRQIMADVLGTELVTVNTTDGAAYGAAVLACVGSGLFSSVDEACEAMISETGRTAPSEKQTSRYEDFYAIYRALYPILKPQYRKLSSMDI
jgi:xylulokinase